MPWATPPPSDTRRASLGLVCKERDWVLYGRGKEPRFGVSPSDLPGGEGRIGVGSREMVEVLHHLPFLSPAPTPSRATLRGLTGHLTLWRDVCLGGP